MPFRDLSQGDLEEFDSPEAFQDRVTRGLSAISIVRIIVGQPEELLIDVELSRSIRFFPFNALDSTSTPDVTRLVNETWNALVHPPGGVTLTVSAPDSRAYAVTAAVATVSAAIDRGRTHRANDSRLPSAPALVVLSCDRERVLPSTRSRRRI